MDHILDLSCPFVINHLNERIEICLLLQQEMGFTKEQSSNALILHGTVEKALESLSGLSGMTIHVHIRVRNQHFQTGDIVAPWVLSNFYIK